MIVIFVAYTFLLSVFPMQHKPESCEIQAHKGDRIKVHYRVSVNCCFVWIWVLVSLIFAMYVSVIPKYYLYLLVDPYIF